MNTRPFVARVVLVPLLLLLACSDDDSTPPTPPLAEQEITPAGGTIELPDEGVTLTFAAGAVAAPTTITVREASRAPEGVVGRAFEFGPSGTQFAEPVEFRFDFLAGDLAGGTLPHELALLTWNGSTWEEVEGARVDAAGSATDGTLTVPLRHFSTYAVATVDGIDTFYGVFGFARDDVYAYGRERSGDGRITRWDGNALGTVGSLPGGRFFDGWGAAPDDHLAVAYDGTGRVLRTTDGTTWNEVATASEALLAIHGNGAWRMAVGYGQTILEDDGTGWSPVTGLPAVPGFDVPRPLHAVVVTGPGEAFAAGDDVLFERSGGTWSLVDLSGVLPGRFTIRGLWARAADDVLGVGWELDPSANPPRVPFVLRHDGANWTVERLGATTPQPLQGVWGAANTAFATGYDGTLLEEAPFFVERTSGTSANLYDVWALDDTTVAFVGAQGTFSYPGLASDPGGGGTGTCTGAATFDLDLRLSQGFTDPMTCGETRTVEGFPLTLQPALTAQGGSYFDCDVSQPRCVDSQDGSQRGGGDTVLFFESCSRISIDLNADARAVGCVEIDLVDYCNEEDCDGGVNSRTVAFLYDAQGALVDVQGSLLSGAETITLDGSAARAVRLDVRFTYGGLEAVRLFY